MHHLPPTHRDHDQQRRCEQIGGDHEHHARVVHAAHVHHGQNRQHNEAQPQCVRLQGRNSGDQSAHASRDAHRGGENVVDHERRSAQKPCALAQVLAGHGVRPAAMRIGLDSLPVTEVDDHQQDHDRRAHGYDVFHAQQAERNQQGQRGFRPVRGRAQCVQPEDGNPRQGADLLGAFFAGRQRPPEQQIQKSCGYAHESPGINIDRRP